MVASAADSPAVGPDALFQYGVTGTVAAIAIVGLVWLYRSLSAAHDREREALVSQIDGLRDRIREETQASDERAAAERARGDRLESELAKLNGLVQQQTMSALNEATRAVTDAIAAIRRRDLP